MKAVLSVTLLVVRQNFNCRLVNGRIVDKVLAMSRRFAVENRPSAVFSSKAKLAPINHASTGLFLSI